jgi:hypothetical protein
LLALEDALARTTVSRTDACIQVTWDRKIRLVEAATGAVRWSAMNCPNQGSTVHRVATSPDGRFVGSVSDSWENWKLWDAASGAEWMA